MFFFSSLPHLALPGTGHGEFSIVEAFPIPADQSRLGGSRLLLVSGFSIPNGRVVRQDIRCLIVGVLNGELPTSEDAAR